MYLQKRHILLCTHVHAHNQPAILNQPGGVVGFGLEPEKQSSSSTNVCAGPPLARRLPEIDLTDTLYEAIDKKFHLHFRPRYQKYAKNTNWHN